MRIFSSVETFKCFTVGALAMATSCTVETTSNGEHLGVVEQAATAGDVAFASVYPVGTLTPGNSFNNRGGTNSVTVLGPGRYRVDFPGLGGSGVNIQLSESCKVDSWATSGTTLQVFVSAYEPGGFRVPVGCAVSVQRHIGSDPAAETAYAWADRPSSRSYTPNPAYQWSSGGGTIKIAREGAGIYRIDFPAQSATGHKAVEATAVGTDATLCAAAPGRKDTEARVRCFDVSGAPADSQFMVVFARKSPNNVASYGYATVQIGSNAIVDSYGAIASQCGSDSPITSPVTVTPGVLNPSAVRVHFPQLTTDFASSVAIAKPYGANSNLYCSVVTYGSEPGGAFVEVICNSFVPFIPPAPAGTQFIVVLSSTQAIFC